MPFLPCASKPELRTKTLISRTTSSPHDGQAHFKTIGVRVLIDGNVKRTRAILRLLLLLLVLKIFKEGDPFSHSCFTMGPPFNYEHMQCKI